MHTEFARAVRALMRTPTFALTAAAILAVGIGATTAMFALVHAVLLRDLAYPGADRLLSLGSRLPADRVFAGRRLGLSQAQYFFLASRARTFDAVGAYDSRATPATLTGDGPAERVEPAYATASLVAMLGLQAELGRTIDRDDAPGARGRVAVLGHDLWVRRYGRDPAVVGKSITLDGNRVPIVGVMRPGAQLPGRRVDVWLPLGADPAAPARNNHHLAGVARVRHGVPLDAVRRELSALTAQLPAAFPSVYASPMMRRGGFVTDAVRLKDEVVGGIGRVLWMLLAAVALVLVIAWANAANLFVARAHARRRDAAVRAALGAGRWRLARQTLCESLVVTGLAGVVGAVLAVLVLRGVVAAAPWEVPRLAEVRFGPTEAAFALVAVLGAGVLFGLLPLLGCAAAAPALTGAGRGTTPSRRQRVTQRALVVGQVATALVLLAASGVMVQSVLALQAVRPGFSGAGVLTVDVALPVSRAETEEGASAAWKRLSEELATLPGVVQVAATERAPLDGPSPGCSAVFVEGGPAGALTDESPCVPTVQVTPGYFVALRIPMRGAAPTWQENDARSAGVVVSQTLARRFWPYEDPIGKGIRGNGGGPPYYRVVGVAGNVRADGLDKPPAEAVYFPLLSIPGAPLWNPPRAMTLILRTRAAEPALLAPAVRRVVGRVEPDAPVTRVRTMDAIVADATARVRFTTAILAAAAATALVLSGVGLYSVMAYLTGQRHAEIAIRLALGAPAAQVLRAVVTQAVGLAAVGIAVGLLGTLAGTEALRALRPDVEANAPAVLAAASLLLLAAAALAGYLPARGAARLSAAEALR